MFYKVTIESLNELFGNVVESSSIARCACVSCNSCTCACSCRNSVAEINWE